MPQIVEVRNPNLGIDIVHAPHGYGLWDGISFKGVAGGWLNPGSYVNHQEHAKLFLREFSLKKANATVAEHWLGYSGNSYFPVTSGHTYLVTGEFRNAGAACGASNLVFYSGTYGSSLNFPGGANQTAYTRIWHTFEASYSRFYVHLYPAVAGTTIQLDIRNLRYFDVTGVDPAYYEAIARLDYYAIRTSLEAIKLRTTHGVTRKGNLLSLDTTTNADEVAAGTPYKAVTANALTTYINNSDNYPKGLVNIAVNPTAYETTWAIWKMVNASQHDVGGMKIFEWMSDTSGADMSWHLNAGSAAMTSWINGVSGKYIVSMDIKDMSEPGTTVSIGIYSAGTKSNITGVPSNTTAKNRWEHIACLVTATGTFQINIDHTIHRTNEHFTLLLKNFNIYNVTNINSSYYPAIAKGQFPLLQGVEPVRITGRSISYSKASMSDVLTNTQNGRCVVDATVLNRVINFGRIRDVTCGALGFGLWKEISFDGGTTWQTLTLALLYSLQYDHKWRNGFSLRNTSSTTGQHWFGYSEPAGGKRFPTEVGHTYLFIADVRNSGAATLSKGQITQSSGASVVVSNGDALPHTANQTTYTRLYSTFNYNASGTYDGRAWLDIFPAVSNSTVQVDVSGWWHFDITDLSSSDIYTLATLSAARLNDIYFRYFIQQESVSPISEIIDLGSVSAVVIDAGRNYKLNATAGSHTITVASIPSGVLGEDAHISIATSASGTVTASGMKLMGKIRPNAINHCTIKYENGVAKLFVDDADYGYVVTDAMDTGDGSLYFGLSNMSSMGISCITFSKALDNTTVHCSGDATISSKPVLLLGNGENVTHVSFDNNSISPTQNITVSNMTFGDITLTSGIMTLDNSVPTGTIKLNGGSISFSGYQRMYADITGSAVSISNNSIIVGPGSINLNKTGRLTAIGCTLDDLTISNGKSGNYGGGFWGDNTQTTQITRNCSIIGCSASASGGGFSYRNKAGSIVNVSVTACTSGSYGGGFETSHNNQWAAGFNDVTNVHVLNCLAVNGGGICIYNNRTNLSNSTIIGCTATSTGAAIVVAVGATANITGCYINNSRGSAAIAAESTTITHIKGCTIANTIHGLQFGGAISTGVNASPSSGYALTIEDCYIVNNNCTAWAGGGIYISNGVAGYTVSIKGCTFRFNSCNYSDSRGSFYGGAMYVTVKSNVLLENCYFRGNTPGALGINSSAEMTVKNCIFDDDAVWICYDASAGSAKLTLDGTNTFNALGCYGNTGGVCITIVSGSTIKFTRTTPENCIIGGTITAAGDFAIYDKYDDPHDYWARSATGSTITNYGAWLPSASLTVAASTSKTLRGTYFCNLNTTAITTTGTSASITLTNCVITGGSEATYLAALATYAGCTLTLTGCEISNNKNTSAANLMRIGNGQMYIDSCTISGNITTGEMIGYYTANGSITNTEIVGNTNTWAPIVYNTGSCTLTVTNCYIHDNLTASNQISGVIYNSGGAVINVIGTTITGNTSNMNTGEVGCVNGATQSYTNCILDGNLYDRGGGGLFKFNESNHFTGRITNVTNALTVAFAAGATFSLRGNTNATPITAGTISAAGQFRVIDTDGYPCDHLPRSVTGSTITNKGQWLPAYRLVVDSNSNITLTGTFIMGNTTTAHGGGVDISGTSSTLTLTGATIAANEITSTARGGGLFISGASNKLYLRSCLVYNNKVTSGVAGIGVENSATASIVDCRIIGNTTTANNGGGIYVEYGTINVEGCTFSNNYTGGGLGRGIRLFRSATVVVKNCVFDENQDIGFGSIAAASSLTLEGHNTTKSVIDANQSNTVVKIASGAVINLTGNNNTNAISGSTITAQGSFTVIDKNGTSHAYSAATKTNSKITNLGVWS